LNFIKNILKMIYTIFALLSNIAEKIGIGLTLIYSLGVTLVVLYGVFGRYIGFSPAWTEELSRWFLIGIAYIGASVALKQGGHVGVTIFMHKIPSAVLKRIFLVIANLLVVAFLIFAFIYSWEAAMAARRFSGEILPFRMVYSKMNIPIGCAFMLIHLIYLTLGSLLEDDISEFYLSKIRTEDEEIEGEVV